MGNALWRQLVATFVLLTTACVGFSAAQDKAAAKQNSREQTKIESAAATVKDEALASDSYVYEFEQPEFFIRRILIQHDGAGHGRISFERKNDVTPLVEPFELSEVALKRITSYWDALRFLDSNTSYQSSKQFPHLGTMRLKMKRGGRERAVEFNWTDDRNAFALANEYRRAADQAIFVFDITLARENQPLEAPKLMDRLDTLLSRKGLSDPLQLVPLLQDLSVDERIPLIARNHAERLLKKIKKF